MSDTIFAILLLISIVSIFFIGMIYGWRLHQEMIARRIRNLVTNLSTAMEEDVIQITIEKHNDMIYVYEKQTNQFMAQGKTKEEIEKILIDKFPGKRFAAPQSELETGFSK